MPESNGSLIPSFIKAMEDIGRYGYEKYREQSFEARMKQGDNSRGGSDRTTPIAIADHAAEHFQMYLAGVKHDHFGTAKHQLAAVAFNAMMEYFFAGLENEPVRSESALSSDRTRHVFDPGFTAEPKPVTYPGLEKGRRY